MRVVGVGAFVERLGVAGVAGGPLHDEVAFGPELPADVLEHEDVALVRQRLVIRVEVAGRPLDAVRRALEDDRQRRRSGLRGVKILVCRRLPSRIGTITSLTSKRSAAVGGC